MMKKLTLEEFESVYLEFLATRRAEVKLLLEKEQRGPEPDARKIERLEYWTVRLTAMIEGGLKGVMPYRCDVCGFICAKKQTPCQRCRDILPRISQRLAWRLGWADF